MKLLIIAGFRIFVSNGEGKRETRFEYAPGMVVDSADLPAGHTAQDWIDKDLAREATPPKGNTPSDSGAPASPTP